MIGLLDTNILIAGGVSDETTPDLSGFEDLRVSSVSWSELVMGLHSAKDLAIYKEREARLNDLRNTFGEGLPYDDECVASYGAILNRVTSRKGEPKAHRFDRMIAATAHAHSLVLVTRNVGDFAMFQGIVQIEPR